MSTCLLLVNDFCGYFHKPEGRRNKKYGHNPYDVEEWDVENTQHILNW